MSLWLSLDDRHPQDTYAWSPIGAGEGPANPDALTVVPAIPTITVAPGQTTRAWVLFLGYRFEGSETPRRVTLNAPGPDGQVIRVTLADPAHGALRWRLPAQRAQMMIGFQNNTYFGGAFQGLVPLTTFARVGRLGPLLWDVGLVSGVAIQQQGALVSATSAFQVLGVAAHLTAPLVTWGRGREQRRLSLYGGGAAAAWIEVLRPDDMKAGRVPSSMGVFTVDGGLQLEFGRLAPASTPFPLDPQGAVQLPRWSIALGYTHAWMDPGSAGGLVSAFRLAF